MFLNGERSKIQGKKKSKLKETVPELFFFFFFFLRGRGDTAKTAYGEENLEEYSYF